MLGNYSGADSRGLYLSQEKENRCLAFTPSIKRETRKFHFVVGNDGKGMYKNRRARAGLLFCQSK